MAVDETLQQPTASTLYILNLRPIPTQLSTVRCSSPTLHIPAYNNTWPPARAVCDMGVSENLEPHGKRAAASRQPAVVHKRRRLPGPLHRFVR
jgi:hypothetical protein